MCTSPKLSRYRREDEGMIWKVLKSKNYILLFYIFSFIQYELRMSHFNSWNLKNFAMLTVCAITYSCWHAQFILNKTKVRTVQFVTTCEKLEWTNFRRAKIFHFLSWQPKDNLNGSNVWNYSIAHVYFRSREMRSALPLSGSRVGLKKKPLFFLFLSDTLYRHVSTIHLIGSSSAHKKMIATPNLSSKSLPTRTGVLTFIYLKPRLCIFLLSK